MTEPDFSLFWGVIVPFTILMISLVLTITLYRKFSREMDTIPEDTKAPADKPHH